MVCGTLTFSVFFFKILLRDGDGSLKLGLDAGFLYSTRPLFLFQGKPPFLFRCFCVGLDLEGEEEGVFGAGGILGVVVLTGFVWFFGFWIGRYSRCEKLMHSTLFFKIM